MYRSRVPINGMAAMAAAAVIGLAVVACSPEEPAASATPELTPGPTPTPTLNAELMDRPWNVLFVGIDHNEARQGAGEPMNADALMLASLSADQSKLTLVSLPRDTVDLPLEDGTTYARKINGLYAEQGIDALVGAMESLYGVEVDGHVVLNMDDFAALVEAVDGVRVRLAEPLVDPIVRLDLEPGRYTLDGSEALGYVRTRVDQDYGRMGRQQQVIVDLVERLTDPDAEVDLAELLEGLDSLESDLPLDQLPTLLELGRRASEADIERLVIRPPLITFEGDRGDGRGYVLVPDVEAIRTEVQGLIGE